MSHYSARLDETGTDGRSTFMLVGGAIAQPTSWNALEASWRKLLERSGVEAYHWQEFYSPCSQIYASWSRLKRETFVRSQNNIIAKHTLFRIAVGVERSVHADVKKRMEGVRGFHPDSDYGLCLRWLMFATCEQLEKDDPSCELSLLVEDGPWASGAAETYERVAAMTGKRKPAKHAHRLVGFAAAPKGNPSLEAADYIAGSALKRLQAGGQRRSRDTLSVMLSKVHLEQWYEGMMEEKEARRQYGRPKKHALEKASSS